MTAFTLLMMLTTAVIGCKLADRASQSKGLHKTEEGFAFSLSRAIKSGSM